MWQQEWKQRITRRQELEKYLELSDEETAWFDRYETGGGKGEQGESVPAAEKPHTSGSCGSPGSSAPLLPFAVTRSWLDRMDGRPDDPLRIQTVPRIGEARQLPCESTDPLFEGRFSPLPGLVHRYEDRVLFYGSSQCGLYCRYCFRRHLTADTDQFPGSSLLERADQAAEYLRGHLLVKELLLSGGDPLTLPDDTLAAVIERFRSARPDLIIRIGSRMPVVLPSRLTPPLARLLGSFAPIFMIIQTNHPRELSAEVVEALGRLARWGIPLLNQSVFLRGVNDSGAVLRELSTALLSAGVLPYYLFQGDLAAGTAHLRAPMKQGLEIMGGLLQRMSGMATPTYAVDLPGGGGKITLPLDPPPRWEGGFFHIPGPGGRVFAYPDEE